MNIPFECNICGKSFTIASSWAGRSIRCECGNLITVPTTTAGLELPRQNQTTKREHSPILNEVDKGQPRDRRESRGKQFVISGIICLVIALAVGVASLLTGVSPSESTATLTENGANTTGDKEISGDHDNNQTLTEPNIQEKMPDEVNSMASNQASDPPTFIFPLDTVKPSKPDESEFTDKQPHSVPARIAMLHKRKYILRDWLVENTTPIKGRLKAKKGSTVTIELPTGELRTIALSELSRQDKQYLYLTSENRESESYNNELLVNLPTAELITTSDNPSQTGNLVSASELPPPEELFYSVQGELPEQWEDTSTPKRHSKPLPITAIYRTYPNLLTKNSGQSPLNDTYIETRIRQLDTNFVYVHALKYKSSPVSIQTLASLIVNLSNKIESASSTQAEYQKRMQRAFEDYRKAPQTSQAEILRAATLRTIANKWKSQWNAKGRELRRLRTSLALQQELVTFLNTIGSWKLKITIYHRISSEAPFSPVARSGIQTEYTIPDFPLDPFLNQGFDSDSPTFPKGIETKLIHKAPILALGRTAKQELLSLSMYGEVYRGEQKLPFLLPNLSNERFPTQFNSPSERIFFASHSNSKDEEELQLFAHHINDETKIIDKAITEFLLKFNNGTDPLLAISPNGVNILGCIISRDGMTANLQSLNCDKQTTNLSPEQSMTFIPIDLAINNEGEFAIASIDGEIQLCRFQPNGVIQITGTYQQANAIKFLQFIDERTLLSVDEIGTVMFYDMKSADVKAVLKIGEQISFVNISPDNKWLFFGTLSGVIRVFTNDDFAENFQLFGHIGSVTQAISFHDAAGSLVFVSGGEDGSIKLWDFTNAEVINTTTANTTHHNITWDKESALGQLRNRIIKRDYNISSNSFNTAELPEDSKQLSGQLDRLKYIYDLSRGFSTRARYFWRGISPNSTLTFNNRQINVVEIDKDFVTLRDQGETLPPRSLHRMTIGLASIVFESEFVGDSLPALEYAAYLVTCDDLTEAAKRRAIKLWSENWDSSLHYPNDLIEKFLTDRY